MKRAIASLLICAFVAQTTNVSAQETPRVEVIKKGEPAPFDGTLFNKRASVEILLGPESDLELKMSYELELEKIKAKYELLLSDEQALRKIDSIRNKEVLTFKEKHILFLTKQLDEKSDNYNDFYFMGGVTIGLIFSLAFFFATKEISDK